eukprot:TRINITY_DN2497_c0_g1_i1.p1 TRINITY_DN2497_c0_g1~~TRINITY_DN2497_c0_g1_i1.p1  ORF type:complete len:289 (+),score=123.08 TRINITY_DN2497_c0_g1_i1:2-868(+)
MTPRSPRSSMDSGLRGVQPLSNRWKALKSLAKMASVVSGILHQLSGSEQCYQSLFVDFDLTQIPCIKLLVAKLLGYLIVAGALGLKLPQIFAIMRAGNAKGISMMMYYLEIAVYTITLAYSYHNNFPFSTFGDTFFILIQDLVIWYLIFSYSGNLGRFFVEFAVFAGAASVLLGGFLPMDVLTVLQGLTIPLNVASRVPQIWLNFKQGDTGSLSFLTFFLNFGGAVARIFTTMQELADPLFLVGYILSAFLNGIIVLQIVYYGFFGKNAAADAKDATSAQKKSIKKSQ